MTTRPAGPASPVKAVMLEEALCVAPEVTVADGDHRRRRKALGILSAARAVEALLEGVYPGAWAVMLRLSGPGVSAERSWPDLARGRRASASS